jgi:hypothetical protein
LIRAERSVTTFNIRKNFAKPNADFIIAALASNAVIVARVDIVFKRPIGRTAAFKTGENVVVWSS